jgi:hypothetical protein
MLLGLKIEPDMLNDPVIVSAEPSKVKAASPFNSGVPPVAVISLLLTFVPPLNVAPPPTLGAQEALNAWVANEAVPNNDPVIPAVTVSDPVTSLLPCERNPFFIMNSFATSFPYPRFGLI